MSDDEAAKWNAEIDQLLKDSDSPKKEAHKSKETVRSAMPNSKQEMNNGDVGEGRRNSVGETAGAFPSNKGPNSSVGSNPTKMPMPFSRKPASNDRLFSSMFRNKKETEAEVGSKALAESGRSRLAPETAGPTDSADDWLGLGKSEEPLEHQTPKRFGRKVPLTKRATYESNSEESKESKESESRLGIPTSGGAGPGGHHNPATERDLALGKQLSRLWQTEKSGGKQDGFEIEAILSQQPQPKMDSSPGPGLAFLGARDTTSSKAPLPFLTLPAKEPEAALSIAAVPRPTPIPAGAVTEEEAILPVLDSNQAGTTAKKKVVMVRKQLVSENISGKSTLQLPSHLIDEDELKLMSSSLKSLYGHQVEMVEAAYKEQIDCLLQSSSRREEMFKEEIKTIHADYQLRFERLKNELTEVEARCRNQGSTNFVALGEHLKTLEAQTDEILRVQQQQSSSFVSAEQNAGINAERVSKEVSRCLDQNMSNLMLHLESSLSSKLSQTILASTSNTKEGSQKEHSQRLGQLLGKFERILEDQQHDFKESETRLSGTEKRIESEFLKLSKEQKKLRETLVKGTVTSITHSLNATTESSKKKEALARQMKEFRKDFRRLMLDIESKHGTMQNREGRLETERKQLIESMEELKASLQQTNLSKNIVNGDASLQNQVVREIEMERRVLEQERNCLVETKVEVSQRKAELERDKAELECQKRILEDEKQQLHHFQTATQLKLNHTEQIRKEAESSRQEHLNFAAEFSRKLEEVERERCRQKAALAGREEAVHVKERIVARDQMELRREKEFVEKVRIQSLCPNCLKLLPPLPSAHYERSDGDGLEVSNQNRTAPFQQQFFHNESRMLNVSDEHKTGMGIGCLQDEYLNKESQMLKEMISDYYGPQIFRL